MEPLARMFGSPARLKLLRLFLFNPDTELTPSDAVFRAKVGKDIVRKEIQMLHTAGLLKRRSGKKGFVYSVDKRFLHLDALAAFLRATTTVSHDDIVKTLKRGGTIRAVVLSGVFTGSPESKADILVVGDSLIERNLSSAVHAIEAELGRELRYASFSTEDFRYRLGVYDRLLRDIFDYPHHVVVDKIGIGRK